MKEQVIAGKDDVRLEPRLLKDIERPSDAEEVEMEIKGEVVEDVDTDPAPLDSANPTRKSKSSNPSSNASLSCGSVWTTYLVAYAYVYMAFVVFISLMVTHRDPPKLLIPQDSPTRTRAEDFPPLGWTVTSVNKPQRQQHRQKVWIMNRKKAEGQARVGSTPVAQ
ncbi:hypothetical protein BJ508DRAFT_325522 [Ascobolus immersus RN42]|uniref:Uncharacterized protein n=1 Tax=Ascobolus immersus RN42 TaxID=1160509 RepID=A0A3N4I8W2_ASCIM|nr:hypothetical protein BJ508DRAFT_325522 [Ascobolus immersus RN42]